MPYGPIPGQIASWKDVVKTFAICGACLGVFAGGLALAYIPDAQVIVTNAQAKTGELVTRDSILAEPHVEQVYIFRRPGYNNMLFCRHSSYPSVQYSCSSSGYNEAANFNRNAVGVVQNVRIRWTESLLTDRWD